MENTFAPLKMLEEGLSAPSPSTSPWVTLSWAQSLNGAIACTPGIPLALSGAESLTFTHRVRSLHQTILVGVGTVLADDPLLNVRLVDGPSPRGVILDTNLRMPLGARIFSRTDVQPWIFYSQDPEGRAKALEARGAKLFQVDLDKGGVNLSQVLATLKEGGISSVMVEGGSRILDRSFLEELLPTQFWAKPLGRKATPYLLIFDSPGP